MKKYLFDGLMIIVMAILLSGVVYFNLEDLYLHFSLILLLLFYFVGQYSQRQFGAAPQ